MQKKLTYDEWVKMFGPDPLERAALINQNTELSRHCFTLKCELTRTRLALWLTRYERAKERANMLRYMWHVLVSVKKSNDKELVKIVRRDYDVWCEVQRKCCRYADKFREEM